MSCKTCNEPLQITGCSENTRYVQPIVSPVKPDANCGTCGGLNAKWTLEDGFQSRLMESISKSQLPTFDVEGNPTWAVSVAELPFAPRGMITFTDGTNPEYFEYQYNQGITWSNVNGVQISSFQNRPGQP